MPIRTEIRDAIGQCRRHFLSAAAFSALVNLLYIVPTLYMLQVYDRVVPTEGLQTLAFLTIILLFALSTLSMLDRVRMRLLVRAGVTLDATLAPQILRIGMDRPTAGFAAQAMREFDLLRGTLTGPGIIALFDAPWTPLYVIICLIVHPLIGLLALVGVVLLSTLAWLNERATGERQRRAQMTAAASYASQDAILSAAEAVRALGMRHALVQRQMRQRRKGLLLQTEANFAASDYLAISKFTRLALQSLALALGALLAIDQQISGGAIFASSFLIARALAPTEQLIGSWKSIVQALSAYKSLNTLLEKDDEDATPTHFPAPQGRLDLEAVTVNDPARPAPILDAISFSIAPGTVLAIVGPSGAGKSTLLRIIAGGKTADGGIVRVDGADTRDWDAEALAQHIGYLPQDATLLAGTVKENIARFSTEFARDRAQLDAAVIAAADRVGAKDMILRLPKGFDHVLQTGGKGLSAGQSQRVAFARALFGNPALIVLDEPNAHLDADGEAALLATITALKTEGRTIIVASHKPGILPAVDTMLVLREGKMEMFGPRDEILKKVAPAALVRSIPRTKAAQS